MIRRLAAALLLGLAMAASGSAQGIGGARASGNVGERFDGYLGLASGASDALRKQVAAVNIKRRSLYSGLASRRGATTDEVGITAACQLLARVAVGEVYLLGDNVWRRRQAGQSAPRPDYCG